MENYKNNPEEEPKVFNKYLVTLTKIVAFYSFFFVLLKSIAIIRGAWMIPNLALSIPFIVLGILAGFTSYYQKYNWFVAVLGAAVIIVVRYYEYDWVMYIQQNYGQ
jgi:hypothetical protein